LNAIQEAILSKILETIWGSDIFRFLLDATDEDFEPDSEFLSRPVL
jgi:hypothetical protein